jgi:DNA-binding PadR family transcriptional regulator
MNAHPQLLVLISLAAGPRHGYAIQQDVAQQFGVSLGPGTLYGAIARLEERGLIRAVEAEGRRRPYELTPPGRELLDAKVRDLALVARVGQTRLAVQ